jgi:L-threonylcarbamoyladenylate synthase
MTRLRQILEVRTGKTGFQGSWMGSMKTQVIAVDPERPDPAALDVAAAILRRGGLVAFATETVYGLGAIATRPEAVDAIFEAKGRPANNPLIVHVSGVEQAQSLVTWWPDTASQLALAFWPGPLSIVLPRSPRVPDRVTAGGESVAIRVPAPLVARGLIEATGEPIAAPSANRSNRVSPTQAEHVLASLEGRIDLVLDSGPAAVGLESTVVALQPKQISILRPGPISGSQIEQVAGMLAVSIGSPRNARSDSVDASRPLSSPGQLPVHYAPRTPAVRVSTLDELRYARTDHQQARMALLVIGQTENTLPPGIIPAVFVGMSTPEEAARNLYRVFHEWDAADIDRIVVVMPPDEPRWAAVRDRLLRATRPFNDLAL